MEIIQEKNEVFKNSSSEDVSFRLKNEAMFIDLALSKMYSFPIRSVVREIISNAVDSHTRSEPKRKILIVHPTAQNPQFVVQDFGVGMSEEEIRNVYCVLGESTKNKTNSQIGGFGLGAKSPFAYTDTFSLVSRKDGVEISCIVYKDESNSPQLNLTNIKKTNLPSGFQVSIPVKQEDASTFREAIDFYAPGFDKYLERTQYIQDFPSEEIFIDKDIFGTFSEKFRRAYLFQNEKILNNYPDLMCISINGVFYSFEDLKLKRDTRLYKFLAFIKCALVLEFETGFLSFTPAREGFVSNKNFQTFSHILEKEVDIYLIRKLYENKVIEIFELHKTQLQVCKELFSNAKIYSIFCQPKQLKLFERCTGGFSPYSNGTFQIQDHHDILFVYNSDVESISDLENFSKYFNLGANQGSRNSRRPALPYSQVLFFFPNLPEYEVLRVETIVEINARHSLAEPDKTVLILTNKDASLLQSLYRTLSISDFIDKYGSKSSKKKEVKEKKKLNYKKLYRKKVSAITPYSLVETNEEIDLANFEKIKNIRFLTLTDFFHNYNKAIEMEEGCTYYILYEKNRDRIRFLQAALSLLIKEKKLSEKTRIIYLNKDMKSSYEGLEEEGFFDLEKQWIAFVNGSYSETDENNFFLLFFMSLKSFMLRHFGDVPDFPFQEPTTLSSYFCETVASIETFFSEPFDRFIASDQLTPTKKLLINQRYFPFSEFIKIISFVSSLPLNDRFTSAFVSKSIKDGKAFNDFILFLAALLSFPLFHFPIFDNRPFMNAFSFNFCSLFLARKTLIDEYNKFRVHEPTSITTPAGDII